MDRLLAVLLLLATVPGCQYLRDRGRDTLDVFRLQGGAGRGLGVTSKLAGVAHAGLSFPGSMPHETGAGMVYGEGYFVRLRRPRVQDKEHMAGVHQEMLGLVPSEQVSRQAHKCWTLLPAVFSRVDDETGPAYPSSPDHQDWLVGPRLWTEEALQENRWAHVHAFDVEVGVYLLAVNGKVGFSPGELADLLLGIFGVDLAADDDRGPEDPAQAVEGESDQDQEDPARTDEAEGGQ